MAYIKPRFEASAKETKTKPTSYGVAMIEIARDQWPAFPALETIPQRVWRSRDYLAVLYKQRADNKLRLTINCTRRNAQGRWKDGIAWDELQRIKNECLGEDTWCIEVFPAQSELVDVQNMRHLWVLDGPCEWRFPAESALDADEQKSLDEALAFLRAQTAKKTAKA